jgi:hypothetical protein
MLDFESLADVRSALHQIDDMIAGLLAQRDLCLREAARFTPEPLPEATSPSAQAQCPPCSGPR